MTNSSSIDSQHFLLRRLHSLFGLLPVGAFLMFHLWENSQSRFGAEYYNEKIVGWLQGLNYLPILEVFVIALPLLFHALYGIVIIRSGRSELQRYAFLHNRFYWLQRISGIGILVFLMIHLGWTRFLTILDPSLKLDLFGHMQTLLSSPLTLVIYVVGLFLAVFHLCYGLWSFAVTWGITTTPRAQEISFWLFMGLALLLAAMGIHGILGFLQ